MNTSDNFEYFFVVAVKWQIMKRTTKTNEEYWRIHQEHWKICYSPILKFATVGPGHLFIRSSEHTSLPLSGGSVFCVHCLFVCAQNYCKSNHLFIYLIYLVFYITPSPFLVTLWHIVGRAEETRTHSWSRFCTVNCQLMVINYQVSHMRSSQDLHSDLRGECVATGPLWPLQK